MLYLDYSANTPVDEAVLQCFCDAERRHPGNANAHHQAALPTVWAHRLRASSIPPVQVRPTILP